MSTIGNGRLDAIESRLMELDDAKMPTLAVAFDGIEASKGDLVTDQVNGASITYVGSTKIMTISFKSRDFAGDDAADVDWTITGGAAKVDWSSRAATALSVKDQMDLLNDIPGISAHVLHAPHNMSVNSTAFEDLAETPLGQGAMMAGYTECMYRDVTEFTDPDGLEVAYMRIGLPEARDGDAFELVDIMGTATGVTDGILKVQRDSYDDQNDTQETYVYKTLVATSNGYLAADNRMPETVRGPILISAASSNITACKLWVKIKQAQIGA